MTQEEARDVARQVFEERLRDFDRLAPIFTNAGIDGRNSSVPLDWYLTPRGWKERNNIFLTSAVDVAERATQQALAQAGLALADIDAIVSVSSTGVATPSLDALLIERMGLRRNVQRLPVFGLGCAGGVLGLARAASWAQAMPGRTILLVVVELCALSFRHGDLSKANVVATALFGDGGAALLLRADPDAAAGQGPTVRAWGEHLWASSLDVMGWRVEDDGLGVVFSQSIPSLVRNRFGAVTQDFLAGHGLTLSDLAGVVCHPGGAKVLEALAEVLAPCAAGLDDAAEVLRQHGNMSAPTALFVLERRLARNVGGPHLMTALGPGFTAAMALLDL
jgi:alkylresorcinol/alkylpyrone synthase